MVGVKKTGDSAEEPARLVSIRSEEDAFKYLQMALANELGNEPIRVEFKNWPILTIKLEGEGYDSTITSQMAEALVALQHALNRTYARTVRGSSNANVLTNEEKRSIQFKAKVEKGSSIIQVDMGEFAETVATQLVSKMDGTNIMQMAIGIAIVGASLLAYKAFLAARSEDRKVDQDTKQRVALSTQETRRLEIMAQALSAQPRLKPILEDFDEVRHEIVKSVSDASTLKVQDVKLTNSEAKAIAATPRTQAVQVQLNGNYMIDKIDWSKEESIRISVSSTDTMGSAFVAAMASSNMSAKHKERLKECEWERKPMHMSINATKLRDEVTTATIVGVEWPKTDTPDTSGA